MTDTPAELRNGVPLDSEYQQLVRSQKFAEMESFSNAFLANNAEALRPYVERWVADPLHQWSRQWEYPFVNDRIRQLFERPSLRVLDAGSGATFFPYYVMSQHGDAHVSCCDYDKSLAKIYDQLNDAAQTKVAFSVADLRNLPFEDQSFDVVYCVSVLEHTNAYEAIVDEFYRVLRPGGKLVITFDISLDGRHDIPASKAAELLALLINKVGVDASHFPTIEAELAKSDFVTTQSFIESSVELLPWKKPGVVDHLKSIITSGRPKSWPADLTYYCLDLDKQ